MSNHCSKCKKEAATHPGYLCKPCFNKHVKKVMSITSIQNLLNKPPLKLDHKD